MKKGTNLFLSFFLAFTISGLAKDKDKETVTQACTDEETMVNDYQKGLSELIGKVQKEKLEEFQRAFHRQSCLSKLNLCEGILDTATACYDQTIDDPATPKENLESYRAKRDAYAKLKEKLVRYRDALKAKEGDKNAKALIETFQPTN